MDIIVWGTGKEYIKNKHLIADLKYRLVDTSKDKQGTFIEGIRVEKPDIILTGQCDYILIATVLYFEDIYTQLTEEYFVSRDKIIALADFRKELLMREIGRYHADEKQGQKKIMFGYCFLIYENCRIHDYLLAESLRLRGAEIIPVICGGAQELQCSFYGGMWGNNSHNMDEKAAKHTKNCRKCIRCDKKTWVDWGNFKPLSAVDFLNDEEKQMAKAYVAGLDIDVVRDWKYGIFPIGKWALRKYFNMELISHKNDWSSVSEREVRSYAYNVLIMCIASEKIIKAVKPDIIYSNDSFYYPYSILEFIAKQEGIPFYNAYGFRKNTYSYAKGEPTVNMPLDSVWKTFSKRDLTKEESSFIKQYIADRKYGRDMMLNTADPFQSAKEIKKDSIYGSLNPAKKTALLAANVTWDASALDKGVVFSNIPDWVIYTVKLFADNKEWQLIIKAHPAEVNKYIPEARERICSIVLDAYNNQLPPNIILIDGDAPISIYELFGKVSLGIVYTSTVGLELCCNGIPVVTVAKAPYRKKGFTYDPVDMEGYRQLLEEIMDNSLSNNELNIIKEQAEKFLLLYYFIYMIPNPFYRFSYEEGAELNIKDANDIMPGQNDIWDYICDSILKEEEILSEDRMPPYLLEV